MRVLVTGSSGFVGTALVDKLRTDGRWRIRASSRRTPSKALPDTVEWTPSPDLSDLADWTRALHDVDVVVHLAARVHVMSRAGGPADSDFHRVNTAGTVALAEQASAAGVRRFVYLSSIKVNGDAGAFTERCTPAPPDAYGESKWAAERALAAVAARTGLEVVIVRPPLVYGPGVKANFQALLRAVSRGVPLPFGGVENRRSLVGVRNLVDLLTVCVTHSSASQETFLVSDGHDVSTPELIRLAANALGREARLPAVPVSWLQLAGRITGQSPAVERLVGSLTVDISKARQLLGWTPPFSMQAELAHMVQPK